MRCRSLCSLLVAAVAGLPCAAEAQQVLVEEGSPMVWLANVAAPGLGEAWTAEGFDDSVWSAAGA